MMTKSWRRLVEALGPGMINLKKFKDMDAQQGRPIPTGGPTRPPLDAPAPPQTDHGLGDPEWLDQLDDAAYHGYTDYNDDDARYAAAKRDAFADIDASGGSKAALARGAARKGNKLR